MSIFSYIKETKGEISHVNWPSKRQALVFSVVVVVVSIVTSLFLGFFDLILSKILNLVI